MCNATFCTGERVTARRITAVTSGTVPRDSTCSEQALVSVASRTTNGRTDRTRRCARIRKSPFIRALEILTRLTTSFAASLVSGKFVSRSSFFTCARAK
jgi:hypothetical protein